MVEVLMVQYQEKQRQSTYQLYTHIRAEIAQMYLRCNAEVWVPTLYPPQSHLDHTADSTEN